MPEFILNDYPSSSAYDSLCDFAKGYVKAMFFTNCDSGDENENRANQLGVQRLTKASIAAIKRDCDAFQRANKVALDQALDLEPGRYGGNGIDAARAGNYFWYARQGHGVSWDDDYSPADSHDCLESLQSASQAFGECYPEIYRGWIHYR